MTEQPEPTRPLDMSEVFDEPDEESTPQAAEAAAGEPGWTAEDGDAAPDGDGQ